jgi:RNA polymerase sigma factor (TIGR02999 family)
MRQTAMAKFDDIYQQLKEIARRELAKHRESTLNTTALVHEAFIKLADHGDELERAHRIHLVTRVMRQITVDHARAKASCKHGGHAQRVSDLPITEQARSFASDSFDLVAFDQALNQLAAHHPRMAHVLELSFFSGVDNDEIAALLGINPRTVQRDLLAARTLLTQSMLET